jgi:hypothetical protein
MPVLFSLVLLFPYEEKESTKKHIDRIEQTCPDKFEQHETMCTLENRVTASLTTRQRRASK